MSQKILRVGKSVGVIIPKKLFRELGLKVGDKVSVEIDRKTKAFIVRPATPINRELIEWSNKFIKQYRKTLEALINK